jgi:hypothetical protein
MKAVCYLRVAKTDRGFTYGATSKASTAPLVQGNWQLPTRQFKLVLNLPDNAFNAVDGSVEIDIPSSALTEVIRVEVEEPAGDE